MKNMVLKKLGDYKQYLRLRKVISWLFKVNKCDEVNIVRSLKRLCPTGCLTSDCDT